MASRIGTSQDLIVIAVAALVGFGAVVVFSLPDQGVSSFLQAAAGMGVGCDINGNISISSGERIYHVPGQSYYRETRIDSRYGERWFCSEVDAKSAGWRKSGI